MPSPIPSFINRDSDGSPATGGEVTFRHALDNTPMTLDYRPEQTITPAVERFHETGDNPYAGEAEAIAEGEDLYAEYCQACHLKDGTGRIGPNLTDDSWKYERADTDVGRLVVQRHQPKEAVAANRAPRRELATPRGRTTVPIQRSTAEGGVLCPNLTDDSWKYERADTDVGRFEIIYGGGAGAMQAFGRRMDQDAILKVMAYIDTFRE